MIAVKRYEQEYVSVNYWLQPNASLYSILFITFLSFSSDVRSGRIKFSVHKNTHIVATQIGRQKDAVCLARASRYYTANRKIEVMAELVDQK